MTITKIGHCCLVIQIENKTVVTDPGSFTAGVELPEQFDIILITHEHADHLHVPTVRDIIARLPEVVVVSNSSVARLLEVEGIVAQVLEGTESATVAGVTLEAFDARHAEIFEDVGQVQNTGYFVGERLFYPGDSYAEPGKPVGVLALPVGGPWCRMTDALHYAIRISPTAAFPVHDGIERVDRLSISHGLAERILAEKGIAFSSLLPGGTLVV
ncbi:MBL fold metallo-hydrolase [Patescibacteria group bacterium]|nr:MBL fold metallo-hydrolase [Patescibacteria group bacterium]